MQAQLGPASFDRSHAETRRTWAIPEPLAWGREHNLTQLSPEQAERLTLIQGDVRDPRDFKVDVIAAQNFSFCIFKVRDELRAYFKTCLEGLNDEGIMVLDIFGGPESIQPAEDETDPVTLAALESFPASDPPAWTGTTLGGR